MFRRLRWRLTATYIFLIIISMLVLGAYLLYSLEGYFYNNLETRLKTQAQLACRVIEDIPHDWSTAAMEDMAGKISRDVKARVTIISSSGVVLGDSEKDSRQMENHLDRPEIQEAKRNGIGLAIRHSSTLGIDMMYVAVPISRNNKTVGFMRLALPLTEAKHAFSKLWSAVLIAILLTVICTAPISLMLGKKVTKPIEKLIEFAGQISKGNFNYQASIQSNDEIGELAKTLNQMTATIDEKVKLISEERSKLKTVLANMTSGVILVNKNGYVDLVNPAAEKFLSFMGQKSIGLPHTTVIKNPELSARINEALKKRKAVEKEIKINCPDESTIEVNISPIRDHFGNFTGVIVVLHDITEIRKLEKMRRDFVANVSHELRTPVTAIKGFTETLLDGALYDQAACKEFIEIIDKEVNRLARLIHDLLELSKIEAKQVKLNRRPANIIAVIRDTVNKLQSQIESAGLTMELNLPDKEIKVNIDQDLIGQVILNLVDNAVKYTPSGGKIQIEVSDKKHDIIVWVRDTGIGIPSKDIERIFERFYRVDKARSRKQGGTGLGLSIVKHIIDIHGGTVGVNSTPGKGSEFFFTLPKTASA